MYNTTKRLIGGKFQAANRPDFRDSVTVFEFPEGWNDPTGTIDLSRDTTKYRYWRFLSPPDRHNQMAEVRFYLAGDTVPNTGKIIGTPGTRIGDPKNHKEAMFDNDPFTFFDAPFPYDGWAGMDYGKPVSMDRILFVYRSDDNNVWIGDDTSCSTGKTDTGWGLARQTEGRKPETALRQHPHPRSVLHPRLHARGSGTHIHHRGRQTGLVVNAASRAPAPILRSITNRSAGDASGNSGLRLLCGSTWNS